MLPTPEISDHDAVYACINTRVSRFKPRLKVIRDLSRFCLNDYIQDFSSLPLNLVYATESADDKLDVLNNLILSCINRHAPLKTVRVTRPPAPWLKDLNIAELQSKCSKERHKAHQTQSKQDWELFREARNMLKRSIKYTKRIFYKNALSSKRPKEVWTFIHRILNPNKESICLDPSVLNQHYLSTATRILNSEPTSTIELTNHVKNLSTQSDRQEFYLRPVLYQEVLSELKLLRMDCSAGHDHIPVQFIKPVLDYLVSPLTHVINSGIEESKFHENWKIGKVSPIPKTKNASSPDDFRPVTVLPILSKVYERLIAKQICDFISKHNVYKDTMSGFRKYHSTDTLLLKIRDDILTSMDKGEVTLAMYVDYSKAFDTVDYKLLLTKLHKLGFSKESTLWMLSYLSDRKQFVQVNGETSTLGNVNFGVPQGSVLGPILFNLYTTDIQDVIDGSICQYADDTTLYGHCKPKDIPETIQKMTDRLSVLQEWSIENNLSFNETKTKIMLFSTRKMSTTHNLKDENHLSHTVEYNNHKIDRVDSYKLLGVHFDEHLHWDYQINELLKSSYKKLYMLRKLKRFTPKKVRKTMAEALLISKIDYCSVLYSNAAQYKINRISKLLKNIAAFVNARYCTTQDVLDLKWLPIPARINFNLLKLAHKSLYQEQFPAYLKGLTFEKIKRVTRNSNDTTIKLKIDHLEKTFTGTCSRLFNDLPLCLKTENNYDLFVPKLKSYLLDKALATYVNSH